MSKIEVEYLKYSVLEIGTNSSVINFRYFLPLDADTELTESNIIQVSTTIGEEFNFFHAVNLNLSNDNNSLSSIVYVKDEKGVIYHSIFAMSSSVGPSLPERIKSQACRFLCKKEELKAYVSDYDNYYYLVNEAPNEEIITLEYVFENGKKFFQLSVIQVAFGLFPNYISDEHGNIYKNSSIFENLSFACPATGPSVHTQGVTKVPRSIAESHGHNKSGESLKK